MKNHIDKATKGKIRKMLKFEVKNLQTDLTEKEWEEWANSRTSYARKASTCQ